MRIAMTAAMLIMSACQAAKADEALAFGVGDKGYSYGMLENASAAVAEEKALAICRSKATNSDTASKCKVVATLSKGCVAVAAGPTWAAWGGGDEELSKETALKACRSHSASCVVVDIDCTKGFSGSTGKSVIVEGRGIKFTGMNMRGDDGTVYNKQTYNKVLIEFAPADFNVKTVDLSKPLAFEGASAVLGVFKACTEGRGVLLFDSAGPRHVAYTCEPQAEICTLGTCRKNLRGPTTVTSDTTFVREGDVFHLRGKATASYAVGRIEQFNSLVEVADFSIDRRGQCQMMNYRLESHREEKVNGDTKFIQVQPPSTIVTQSEPGATCEVFKNPMD